MSAWIIEHDTWTLEHDTWTWVRDHGLVQAVTDEEIVQLRGRCRWMGDGEGGELQLFTR